VSLDATPPHPPSADRILRKALELFSKKGYDATSVREICEAAGITKPTLYHFYGSKEGVYRALVGGALGAFHARMLAELEAPGTVEQRLKRMAWAYFAIGLESEDVVRFILSLVHNPSSAAPATEFPEFYEELSGRVGRVVAEGVAQGELAPGPASVRVLVLMGALGEALCGYLTAERPQLDPALADSIVETVLKGWLA